MGKHIWGDKVIPFIMLRGNYRREEKELGTKIRAITEHLKENSINISQYDIEKIMQHYNLTPGS